MVLKIGHRGAMGHEPENTMASFRKAVGLGVDMVEMDVHVCRTGEVVVIHDVSVDRTTDGKGDVSGKSFKDLRKLDAGGGQRIPTLEEVLDLVDRRVQVNIELKGEGTAKPVSSVIERYVKARGWSRGDFMVSSFNHGRLEEFKRLSPGIRTGALAATVPAGNAEFAERVNAYSVNILAESVSGGLVRDAHKRGIKVLAWTVNEQGDIERMKRMGVDGIISDFPDRI